jgi:hypothetical protein
MHASLVHAAETDRSRVEGSIQPHSIGTRTLITQCSAGGSVRDCWFADERETQVRMDDTDEGMQIDSSNSSCMHDWFKPQIEREVESKGLEPHNIRHTYLRYPMQCFGNCWNVLVDEGRKSR